jgi:hypothetical protein
MDFNELQKEWEQAKASQSSTALSGEQMEEKIKANSKLQLNQHLGNGAILLITWLGIAAFYLYKAPLETSLGRLGISLLLGSLGIRIVLEAFSFRYYSRIQPTLSTRAKEEEMLRYYHFRKSLHDKWTAVIILLYLLGVGLQIPEFSNYIAFDQILLYLGLFALCGGGIFWLARRSTVREMNALRELIKLAQDP